MAERVRIAAPAKVNLRLCVLAREASGFHSLETLFCGISLADTLDIRLGVEGIELRIAGEQNLGPPDRNLCVRAAERFFSELRRPPRVEILLRKRIPAAAGLGGGSSDAAATLRALNHLHGEPLRPDTLLRLGAELGSDVPFFLCGSPYALAWGRGERLLSLPPLPPHPVLVVHPGEPLPTDEAFRRIAAARGESGGPSPVTLSLENLTRWERLVPLVENDFEAGAAERIPPIGEIRRMLNRGGAALSLLAGSGSCVFGVFEDERTRDGAAADVEAAGFRSWRAETLSAFPDLEMSVSE